MKNEHFEYDILGNNKIKITEYIAWESKAVIIPDFIDGKPVTFIGNSAFWGCSFLISITIPPSVTTIGYSAFKFCADLAKVIIPQSVKHIEAGAFAYCPDLKSIIIPVDCVIEDNTFGSNTQIIRR